jgi:hypothetical protein
MSLHYINWHKAHFKLKTRESWSGDHRYPSIPNFEWGNERNETDLSYNLFISWPSTIYKFL